MYISRSSTYRTCDRGANMLIFIYGNNLINGEIVIKESTKGSFIPAWN